MTIRPHTCEHLTISSKGYTLVFGSGGARGGSYLGVLQAIIDQEIPVAGIIGVSMGAAVAGLFGSGVPLDKICAVFAHWPKADLFRGLDWKGKGLLRPEILEKRFERLGMAPDFSQLAFPLKAVATRLGDGRKTVFSLASLPPRVAASCVIIGIFSAKEIDGEFYVDGGYSSPVPVELAPVPERCIAVNPNRNPVDTAIGQSPNLWQAVFKPWGLSRATVESCDLLIWNLVQRQLEDFPGLVITPPLGDLSPLNFARYAEAAGIGYDYSTTFLRKHRGRLLP